MSTSINALNGSGMSLQFEEFARLAGKSSNVVRFLGSADAPTVHEVSVTKSDKVGNTWFRSDRGRTRSLRPERIRAGVAFGRAARKQDRKRFQH